MSRRPPLQPYADLAEMMARDAEAAGGDFGGYAGESITGGPAPPSPPPPLADPASAVG